MGTGIPVHSIWNTETTQNTDVEEDSNEDMLDTSNGDGDNDTYVFDPNNSTDYEQFNREQQGHDQQVSVEHFLYQCSVCQKGFRSKDAERYHGQKVCPGATFVRIDNASEGYNALDSKWACRDCDYVAVKRDALRAHRKDARHGRTRGGDSKTFSRITKKVFVKGETPVKQESGEGSDEEEDDDPPEGTNRIQGLIKNFQKSKYILQHSDNANIPRLNGNEEKQRTERKEDGKWGCNKCDFIATRRDDLRLHREEYHSDTKHQRGSINKYDVPNRIDQIFPAIKPERRPFPPMRRPDEQTRPFPPTRRPDPRDPRRPDPRDPRRPVEQNRPFPPMRRPDPRDPRNDQLRLRPPGNNRMGNKMHSCIQCNYVALTTDALNRHSELRHPDTTVYTCRYCFFECLEKIEMKRHEIQKHGNPRKNNLMGGKFQDMISIDPM